MILPIYLYGESVLRKKAEEIPQNTPEIKAMIDDMFATMYQASGVGLAGPQVGKSLRIFVVDTAPFVKDNDDDEFTEEEKNELMSFKRVFINPVILEEKGESWKFNEGCLSIPKIREDVLRPSEVKIQYLDEDFLPHTEVFKGIIARVIQHEYDHLEGILFTDRISPFKRKLLQGKLNDISKGLITPDYKFKIPKK
ncbi:MAG: peptide deformylase [Bacteroidia bacterium]|nr:peptide deformylase [Bacteroidia bacterium]